MTNNLQHARLFEALGDPTRLAVVARLCQGPATVTELAQPSAVSLPTFLQHLKVLERSGWIRSAKTGRVRICEIEPRALELTGGWLAEQRRLWERRLDQLDALLIRLHQEEKKKP